MSAATLSWSGTLGGMVGVGKLGGVRGPRRSCRNGAAAFENQHKVVGSAGGRRSVQRARGSLRASVELGMYVRTTESMTWRRHDHAGGRVAGSVERTAKEPTRGLRVRGAAIVDRSDAAAAELEEQSAAAAASEMAAEPAVDLTLDEVAAAGAAMAALTAVAAPAAAIADRSTPPKSGKDKGGASNAGAATGPAPGAVSRLRRANPTGALLSCHRDLNVTTAALPRLQRLEKGKKFPVLFYAPEMEELAKKIVEEEVGDSSVELGSINWRTFNDGFPDLFVNDAYGVRDRHVAFLASFHSPEVIFEQISIIYSLPKMFVASFTLILPFFPTGTSERVEREGEIATAVTLARMLSNIPPSRGGPCSTLIFDIHALQERFYFGDNILPCFESGIPLLLNRLARCEDAENIVIAYPDEGAWKRFHGFFKGMEEVVCTKVREGEKRLVKLKEGEPAGRHVVVVDDLVQSGGTLIECQKLLSRLGAVKVSAYVTHGVFPGDSWKRFTASSGAGGQGFNKFFLTDSCPGTAKAVEGIEPFEILSLSKPIAEALHV